MTTESLKETVGNGRGYILYFRMNISYDGEADFK